MASVYAQVADVQARDGYHVITDSTKPSTADVQSWIEEAEAQINGALLSIEVSPVPVVNTNGIAILRSRVCDYAESKLRQVYASAGGVDSQSAALLLRSFAEFIDRIFAQSSKVAAMLQGGAPSDGAFQFRSHASNHGIGSTGPRWTTPASGSDGSEQF